MKASRTVWSGGKLEDSIKELPITIYRREVSDRFGLLLFDEQAYPKIQRQFYPGDAEYSRLERKRRTPQQDERDSQKLAIYVYLQVVRSGHERRVGRLQGGG